MYAPVPMVPGPVTVHPEALAAMQADLPSGDVDEAYFALYGQAGRRMAPLLGVEDNSHDLVFMTGEGMLALWSALKSVIAPGDTVLSVGTGFFGDGIGDMAKQCGARVERVSLPHTSTIGCGNSLARIEEAIKRFRPKMITAVHCETPSGTLNPLAELGELKKTHGVPLFYVDAVSSIGGTPVLAAQWHVDLLLGGSQKCLSAPPSLCFMAVSPAAWARAAEVNYQGYEALLPWKNVVAEKMCPYTPYWHGLAALNAAAAVLLRQGPQSVYARHAEVAEACRRGLHALGLPPSVDDDAVPSPTVTAAYLPKGVTYAQWAGQLKERGLVIAKSYGHLDGKIFRLGHMGTQASMGLMDKALAILGQALEDL